MYIQIRYYNFCEFFIKSLKQKINRREEKREDVPSTRDRARKYIEKVHLRLPAVFLEGLPAVFLEGLPAVFLEGPLQLKISKKFCKGLIW